MTISDKIRIYELSRDLNLENKDILDAAQKLSISVKSHSSSITSEEAKKIKYGEAKDRAIYGEASVEQTKELIDEDIDVLPLPFSTKKTN